MVHSGLFILDIQKLRVMQSQGYTREAFWFDSILNQLHTKEVFFFLLVVFDGNVTSKRQGFSFRSLTPAITVSFSNLCIVSTTFSPAPLFHFCTCIKFNLVSFFAIRSFYSDKSSKSLKYNASSEVDRAYVWSQSLKEIVGGGGVFLASSLPFFCCMLSCLV